jgi:hypothetical protein
MVSQLNAAQREQSRGGDQILQAVEQLRELTKAQESRFSSLQRYVDGLKRSVESARQRTRA